MAGLLSTGDCKLAISRVGREAPQHPLGVLLHCGGTSSTEADVSTPGRFGGGRLGARRLGAWRRAGPRRGREPTRRAWWGRAEGSQCRRHRLLSCVATTSICAVCQGGGRRQPRGGRQQRQNVRQLAQLTRRADLGVAGARKGGSWAACTVIYPLYGARPREVELDTRTFWKTENTYVAPGA